LNAPDRQIVSKKRVADHGEVYTGPREVNAMLDLVKPETERIESRFLEPACGTGNFLIEILRRKLQVVENRYKKSRLEYERNAVIAVSSLYGIDILEDNVIQCRSRLYDYFSEQYRSLFKAECNNGSAASADCEKSVAYILSKNIIWGDALTLQTVGANPKPIIFAEWSAVNGSMIKRRDFSFHELLYQAENNALPLFSDADEDVFLPEPVKEYPLVHYLRVGNVN
jgi:SAM-dependent methyltransferase